MDFGNPLGPTLESLRRLFRNLDHPIAVWIPEFFLLAIWEWTWTWHQDAMPGCAENIIDILDRPSCLFGSLASGFLAQSMHKSVVHAQEISCVYTILLFYHIIILSYYINDYQSSSIIINHN